MSSALSSAIILQPDAQSILSVIGIVLVVGGVWAADRKWDEKGAAAYKQAEAVRDAEYERTLKAYNEARGESGSSVRLTEKGKKKLSADAPVKPAVVIPEKDLDEAFTFPFVFVGGWGLIAASYLLGGTHKSALFGALFSAAIGVVASVPMADAVRARKPKKKKLLSLAFVSSWLGLSVSTALDASGSLRNGGLSLGLCLVGAVSIIASMKVLWIHRKMGDSWEQHGKPNDKFVLYQPGGPLFVFGFFLFWVGINGEYTEAINCAVESCGLPILLNVRTFLAFLMGCGMVPVVMMVDYAHDEGSKFVGFGTSGQFFGRFWESPIPFFTAWAIFGASNFFDADNSLGLFYGHTRTWVIQITCILQSIVAGYLIQTALYKGDMKTKVKWSIVFVLLFLNLSVNLGFKSDYSGLSAGGLGLALSLPGAILVIAGQKTSFGDRKRGDYYMINHAPNPNPVVYSPGQPLFMLGWIFLSLAISFHY